MEYSTNTHICAYTSNSKLLSSRWIQWHYSNASYQEGVHSWNVCLARDYDYDEELYAQYSTGKVRVESMGQDFLTFFYLQPNHRTTASYGTKNCCSVYSSVVLYCSVAENNLWQIIRVPPAFLLQRPIIWRTEICRPLLLHYYIFFRPNNWWWSKKICITFFYSQLASQQTQTHIIPWNLRNSRRC